MCYYKPMKKTIRNLTADVLQANSKAIAGALSGAVVTFFTQAGIQLETDEQTALYTLIGALLGALIVWVSPANRPKRK